MNDLLAKLLANENIFIDVKNVDTASFNVVSRILTLPNWSNASEHMEMMLTLHEVGHALFSSLELLDVTQKKNLPGFKSYVNIVEDARIERLVKMKYPGAKKDFFLGYMELYKRGFFKLRQTDHETLNKLCLVDRFNLYFKIGHVIDVPFSPDELPFIKRGEESFDDDDVLRLAEDIYNFSKSKKEEETSDRAKNQEGESDGSSDERTDDPTNTEATEQNSHEEALTEDILKGSLKTLVAKVPFEEGTIDLEPKMLYLKESITWISIYLDCEQFNKRFNSRVFDDAKRHQDPIIRHLIKEFQMKKSAQRHANTQIAKSGELSMNRIVNFRTSDEIFKKIEIHADEQDHSFIFFLDISGSMLDKWISTLTQLYSLVKFAKLSSISFDVYGFTSAGLSDISYRHEKFERFSMLKESPMKEVHLFSSEMNSEKMDTVFRALWNGFLEKQGYMSATPLVSMLVSSLGLISKFKKKYPFKKLSVIELTDGIGDGTYIARSPADQKRNVTRLKVHSSLNKRIYPLSRSSNLDHMLYQIRKDSFPDVKFVSFFVSTTKPSLLEYARTKCGYAYKINGDFAKNVTDKSVQTKLEDKGYAEVSKLGFDKSFVLLDSRQQNGYNFLEWDSGRINGNLLGRASDKIVMTEFIKLIA